MQFQPVAYMSTIASIQKNLNMISTQAGLSTVHAIFPVTGIRDIKNISTIIGISILSLDVP
jgi:hypothetical protein